MICSYCDSKKHNILSCPEDSELDKILTSDKEPNFSNFSLKTLKKLMVILDVNPSYPPIRMRLILKRRWMYEKKKREETKREETTRKETTPELSSSLMRSEQIHECPICMDDMIECVTAKCTTPCGHTFCTTCFVMSVMRKNTCPMCRTNIIDNNDYVDIMNRGMEPIPIQSIPIQSIPIPLPEPINVIYPMYPTAPLGMRRSREGGATMVSFTNMSDTHSFSFTYSVAEPEPEIEIEPEPNSNIYRRDTTTTTISAVSSNNNEYVSFDHLSYDYHSTIYN